MNSETDLRAVNVKPFISENRELFHDWYSEDYCNGPDLDYSYLTLTGNESGMPLNFPTLGQRVVLEIGRDAFLMSKIYGGKNDLYLDLEVGVRTINGAVEAAPPARGGNRSLQARKGQE